MAVKSLKYSKLASKKLVLTFLGSNISGDSCVPGGLFLSPTWKIDFYNRKGHFFFMRWILAWNQLNFEVYYLFLAQFWQILAISSLKLPKNFKILKIELEMSYITQKKAEIIQKSVSWQKNMICLRKKQKKRISWFFGWKLGRWDIFAGQFLKIFKQKPKIWLHQ